MMNRLLHYPRQAVCLAGRFVQANWLLLKNGDHLDQPQRFCLFVGYPRSGHSIVGSLLDAHPDLAIARELDVMQYLYAHFGRRQIMALLLDNTRQAHHGRRRWRYDYSVPGQWQGRWRTLTVVGDKHGEATTLRLQANPELLKRLQQTIPWPLKVVHVIRNPYDNIATINLRTHPLLAEAVDYYFSLARTVAATRPRVPADDWLDVWHEDFIQRPEAVLGQLCRFLGVEPICDHLAACAAIVKDQPHRSRSKVAWTEALRRDVATRQQEYPWLHAYDFEN